MHLLAKGVAALLCLSFCCLRAVLHFVCGLDPDSRDSGTNSYSHGMRNVVVAVLILIRCVVLVTRHT